MERAVEIRMKRKEAMEAMVETAYQTVLKQFEENIGNNNFGEVVVGISESSYMSTYNRGMRYNTVAPVPAERFILKKLIERFNRQDGYHACWSFDGLKKAKESEEKVAQYAIIWMDDDD